LRFNLTWGLGGMATVLLFLLIGTGLLLKFVYEPTISSAYASILYLESQVPFGQLLRNLHRWSGYGLILAAFLHLLRVFYTGAHNGLRRWNWVIGLGLFAFVVFSNFTGYLLPWDQVSYWAVTVSTSMLDYVPGVGPGLKALVLGGPEPGQPTLMNFYALHTAILPALLLFLLPFHFWRIRRVKGLVIPRSPEEDLDGSGPEVDAMPHLIVREAATALLLLAAVLLVAMLFNAPLAEQANPGLSPNPTKAPWYFMGLQELLMHFHPLIAVVVIPALTVLAIVCIPWLDPATDSSGVWFRSRRGRRTALLSLGMALVLTVAAVWITDLPGDGAANVAAGFLSGGLLPFLALVAVCALVYVGVRRLARSSHSEGIQAVFTLLLTGFFILMLIGVWFRGPGMQLGWAGG
jgi:quinol-cytochrome oxidoreductase complex cytochrome b subunit